MAKILMILPPHKADFNSWLKPSWAVVKIPPIGLFAIKSYVESKGHKCGVLDCRRLIYENKTNNYLPEVTKYIQLSQPDVIGVNAITAIMPEAIKVCKSLREHSQPLIIGGVHPSTEPKLTLSETGVDGVCVGAGEETVLDILNHSSIKVAGMYGQEPREPVLNLDKYPFIKWDPYYTQFSAHLTCWAHRGTYAMTSRSCPYSCRFCASDWSKPVRFHSAEYVVEMAQEISKGVDGILFADDTIALNRTRIEKICHGLLGKGIRWVGSLRADQVDRDLLVLMKEAGCYHIGIGIESGSDKMLGLINKKTTVKMNRKAIDNANEVGLSLTLSFILGMPQETNDDMQQTLSFMKTVKCNGLGVGTFRPLPGSPFYREFTANNPNNLYLRDWDNLGNFSVYPKYQFCEGDLARYYEQAVNLAYANQFTSVMSDIYGRNKKLVDEMAQKTSIRICSGSDFRSTTHKPLRMLSFHSSVEQPAISLYLHLPYKVRRQIKLLVEHLTRIKLLKKVLWRYSDSDLE